MIARIIGNDLTPIPGHDHLLLNPSSTRPICSPTPSLRSKYHVFLDRLRIIEGESTRDNWTFPKTYTNTMAVLL